MIKLASKSNCTGCMVCADSCPKGAISSCWDKSGHLYPKIDIELCISCGNCTRICPILNFSQIRTSIDGIDSKPYAAWSTDDRLRKESSSGGVFASLAKEILKDGGVVVGAKMNGFEVKHVVITDLFQLGELQGSKYLQGDLTGVYMVVKKLLRSNIKVLFGGIPCQVVGLKRFLQKNYENLYTVDLICGGFPSALPLSLLRKRYPNTVRIVSFRDKTNGWKSTNYQYSLKVESKREGIIDLGIKNLPIIAFGASITHRLSCYHCKFAQPIRESDITIGDFWGDKRFSEQHYDGLSLIVPHTQRGIVLLNNSDVEYEEVTWAEAILRNMALVNGRKFVRFHFARIFMRALYKYCSYEFIMNMYLGKGFWGFLYKVNTVLVDKVSKMNKRNVYNRVVKELDK